MSDATSQRIRYGRIITVLFGTLCLALGINELIGGFQIGSLQVPPRWNPAVVTFPQALRAESWFFIAYAGLLFLPWGRLESRKAWNALFALLCVASVWVEGSCNRLSWGRVFSPETHPVGEAARARRAVSSFFIVSSTESAVGSRSSSTIRPSARKMTRSA